MELNNFVFYLIVYYLCVCVYYCFYKIIYHVILLLLYHFNISFKYINETISKPYQKETVDLKHKYKMNIILNEKMVNSFLIA